MRLGLDDAVGRLSRPERRCRDCASCWQTGLTELWCSQEMWVRSNINSVEKLTEFLVIETMAESCLKYGWGPGHGPALIDSLKEKYGAGNP